MPTLLSSSDCLMYKHESSLLKQPSLIIATPDLAQGIYFAYSFLALEFYNILKLRNIFLYKNNVFLSVNDYSLQTTCIPFRGSTYYYTYWVYSSYIHCPPKDLLHILNFADKLFLTKPLEKLICFKCFLLTKTEIM